MHLFFLLIQRKVHLLWHFCLLEFAYKHKKLSLVLLYGRLYTIIKRVLQLLEGQGSFCKHQWLIYSEEMSYNTTLNSGERLWCNTSGYCNWKAVFNQAICSCRAILIIFFGYILLTNWKILKIIGLKKLLHWLFGKYQREE